MRRNRLLFVGACAALWASTPVAAQSEGSGDGSGGAAPSTTDAAATPASTPAAPVATAAPASDPSYDLQMYELEDQLNELKEGVFASKARLRMLWNQLMQERIGGARVEVAHVNDLGGIFEVTRVSYMVDGAQVFVGLATEDPELATAPRLEVYSSPAPAGPHTVGVVATVQGRARGVFTYMRGYQFEVRGGHSFFVQDGATAQVDMVLFDRGNSVDFLQRPSVRADVEVTATEAEVVPAAEGEEAE